jgi:hypothetical protein
MCEGMDEDETLPRQGSRTAKSQLAASSYLSRRCVMCFEFDFSVVSDGGAVDPGAGNRGYGS